MGGDGRAHKVPAPMVVALGEWMALDHLLFEGLGGASSSVLPKV